MIESLEKIQYMLVCQVKQVLIPIYYFTNSGLNMEQKSAIKDENKNLKNFFLEIKYIVPRT